LLKEPSSASYAQNLLGVEYVQNQQFAEARNSFEEAVRLMPHESVNHSNLGVSLAVAGDWNSADQEARRALALDPNNASAKTLLDLAMSRMPRTAKGKP
jgi:Flp pilus assembly protein TadD